MDWIDLAQEDRRRIVVKAVMGLRILYKGQGHHITGHQGPRGGVEV
jgi:hypothetical protein